MHDASAVTSLRAGYPRAARVAAPEDTHAASGDGPVGDYVPCYEGLPIEESVVAQVGDGPIAHLDYRDPG